MNPWLKRLHLIVTIGGGFLGLVLTATIVRDAFNHSLLSGFISLGGILFFIYAIVVGIRLAEGRASRTPLLWFYALQIPLLSSSVITYRVNLGAHVYAGLLGGSFYWNLGFGDNYDVGIGREDAWGIGVNLFALGMYLITRRNHAV